jgi:hypothetical protein
MRHIKLVNLYFGLSAMLLGWVLMIPFSKAGTVTDVDIGGVTMIIMVAICAPFWSEKN